MHTTGFSFGGVLAQMLAAHLWLLPLTNTDKLTSNLICITFGQPLIRSDLLTHVAEIFPDFKKNVHAIGSDNDSFPAIIEKVDCLTSTDDQQVYFTIGMYEEYMLHAIIPHDIIIGQVVYHFGGSRVLTRVSLRSRTIIGRHDNCKSKIMVNTVEPLKRDSPYLRT